MRLRVELTLPPENDQYDPQDIVTSAEKWLNRVLEIDDTNNLLVTIIDSTPEKPAKALSVASKPPGAAHPDACVLCSGQGWSVEYALPDLPRKAICPDCGGFGIKRERLRDLLNSLVELLQPKPDDVFDDLSDWAARNGWLHPDRNDFEIEMDRLGWVRKEKRLC